jgi:hypothetical protein
MLARALINKFVPGKLVIEHDGKTIPIVVEHRGKRASRSRVHVDGSSGITLSVDALAGVLTDERSAYYAACSAYASYISFGPVLHYTLERLTEYFLAVMQVNEHARSRS